ncbi:hypothetical protein LXM94_07420, partial [Rhizobium sp. TRM95111]|nr:hypothetical protein [Rhizobium alarense]
MQAALIVMTILGCDDSVTQCHYIDTVNRSWQTVALCDAQSETQIARYQNRSYPVIVAVCETDGAGTTAEAHEATPKVGKPAPGTETA